MPQRTTPPEGVSHADILARLGRGDEQFRDVNAKLAVILDRLEPIPGLQADMTEMKEDVAATKELVEAWAAVKTLSRFLKWVAAIIAALAVITATTKTGFAHMLGSIR